MVVRRIASIDKEFLIPRAASLDLHLRWRSPRGRLNRQTAGRLIVGAVNLTPGTFRHGCNSLSLCRTAMGSIAHDRDRSYMLTRTHAGPSIRGRPPRSDQTRGEPREILFLTGWDDSTRTWPSDSGRFRPCGHRLHMRGGFSTGNLRRSERMIYQGRIG